MVFSSVPFLFFFLPFVLFFYHITPFRYKNCFLLMASLVFYAWGEGFYFLIMVVSIAVNWGLGNLLTLFIKKAKRGFVLTAGVVFNIGLLALFKYANFMVDNINCLISLINLPPVAFAPVHLPLGISFFTFQSVTYIVDIYRNKADAQKNPVDCGLYISLFPQLIAGPIVRYNFIERQIKERSVSADSFSYGVERFIYGLGKKVIIANNVGVVADHIFALQFSQMGSGTAWLGAACYTIQIYFDFSGYSDMAIGLGYMFGFKLPENFNYPYIARSIREFWRRWHMTLSGWFKDYLYIPLGGSKKGAGRTYANLLIVFFLCGLWHGAQWTFVVWGLFHGFFLVIERLCLGQMLQKVWRPVSHVYTVVVVMTGWIFFRSETLSGAAGYIQRMFWPGGAAANAGLQLEGHLNAHFFAVFCAGVMLSLPLTAVTGYVEGFRDKSLIFGYFMDFGHLVLLLSVFILSVAYLAAGSYNPFIYFRF